MNKIIMNRVPHIIFLYWVIKIALTTLGETGADMFSMTFNLGYGATSVIFMGMFFLFFIAKNDFQEIRTNSLLANIYRNRNSCNGYF